MQIKIIGAGLAGCEAALWLADHGVQVDLYEQKAGQVFASAQKCRLCGADLLQLLKAERPDSASGLLKIEMRMMGSHRCWMLPGTARAWRLAVHWRWTVMACFPTVTAKWWKRTPGITVHREEADDAGRSVPVLVASGPLTEGVLAGADCRVLDRQPPVELFDAVAPISDRQRGYDYDKVLPRPAMAAARRTTLNCPFNKRGIRGVPRGAHCRRARALRRL